MIVPVEKEKVRRILDERGVVAIVGMYGRGKGLIVEWLFEELKDRGDKVVRICLKDLPTPSEDDIPGIFGYTSYSRLHADYRRRAEQAEKQKKKFVVVIEEAQKMIASGTKLWEILTSLRYYQREKILIVLSGQPLILESDKVLIKRLVGGSVVYPRDIRLEEIEEYLEECKYERSITQISRGHWGSIKYLAQLIRENKYQGEKLSVMRVIKWARERGDMNYFLAMVWEGLGRGQRHIIRSFVQNRKVENNLRVEELVRVGVFNRGGGRLQWGIPWTLPFVREFVNGIKEERVKLGVEELARLGKKERLLWGALVRNQGKVVSYDELGDAVWGENAEFSLWALSRLVRRVAKKLVELGYEDLIENVRGIGYRWGV